MTGKTAVLGIVKGHEERQSIRAILTEAVRGSAALRDQEVMVEITSDKRNFLDFLAANKNTKLILIDSRVEGAEDLLSSVAKMLDQSRPILFVISECGGAEGETLSRVERLNDLGVEQTLFRPYSRKHLIKVLSESVNWMIELPSWVRLMRASRQLIERAADEKVVAAVRRLHEEMPENLSIGLLLARLLGFSSDRRESADEALRVLERLNTPDEKNMLCTDLALEIAKKTKDPNVLFPYVLKKFKAAPSSDLASLLLKVGSEMTHSKLKHFRWLDELQDFDDQSFREIKPILDQALTEICNFEDLDLIFPILKKYSDIPCLNKSSISECFNRLIGVIESAGGTAAIANRIRVKQLSDFGSLVFSALAEDLKLSDYYVSMMAVESRVIEAQQQLSANRRRNPKWHYFYIGMARLAAARGRELEAREYLEAARRNDMQFSPNEAKLVAQIRSTFATQQS